MPPRSTIFELLALLAVWVLFLFFVPGCNQKPGQQPTADAPPSEQRPERPGPSEPPGLAEQFAPPSEAPLARTRPRASDRSLADLLNEADGAAQHSTTTPGSERAETDKTPDRFAPAIDEDQLRATGVRRLQGKHLTLYTDLPQADEIDALPGIFDQAVPQWCAYFRIEPLAVSDWRVTGSLMLDREKFVALGLLTSTVPDFRNGYAFARQLWLYEQPTDYYRRHLLLHEGTHAFMVETLGSCGPPWYMEGMAELLATHTYRDGKLRLNQFPESRKETAMLGRIKLVQDAFQAGRAMTIERILTYDNRAHLENEPYAWCWALAALLDGHPAYRDRFRALLDQANEPRFTQLFLESYAKDFTPLRHEWQLFVGTLEYKHDLKATAVDFAPAANLLPAGSASQVEVHADRGWQNTGCQVVQGRTYRISATGRYQLNDEPRIWWSEPGGVTIEYYNGHPLGMLLGTILPTDNEANEVTPLLSALPIGLESTIEASHTGTLFLQLNDSPGDRANNAGKAQVEIAAL